MALVISTDKGTFDVPNDFTVSINMTSPIYSEKGSQTISESLPGTLHNLSLVDNSHRLDIASVPARDIIATLTDGIYRRKGKMNIISASRTAGIVCNVGFDESLMYASWNNVKLCELPKLPLKKFGKVTDVIDHLNLVLSEKETADYHIFAVKTKDGILNLHKDGMLKSNYETITKKFDNKDVVINVSVGYMITPFLKVSWLLDFIFASYGYKLLENTYAEHYQFQRMVILNNCADTVLGATINYAHLLPNCTVNDFIDSLFSRHGAVVFVDSNTMTAKIKLIKDIIRSEIVDDITLLSASPHVVSFSSPKRIKLTLKTSLEGAAPAVSSWEDMMKKCDGVMTMLTENKYYKTPNLQYKYNLATGNIEARDIFDKSIFNSSPFFSWDTDKEIEAVEIEAKDECIPMSYYFEHTESMTLIKSFYLPFLSLDSTLLQSHYEGVDIDKSDKTDMPLAFCFAQYQIDKINYGTTMCRDINTGERYIDKNNNEYDISLIAVGEDGSYNRFFREYDAILRCGDRTITADYNLSKQQLAKFSLLTPKVINGQRLLVESLTYNLPLKSAVTLKMHTIKLPKSLVSLNLPIAQTMCWSYSDNEVDAIDRCGQDYLSKNNLSLVNLKFSYKIRKKVLPLASDFPYPLPVTDYPTIRHSRNFTIVFEYTYQGVRISDTGFRENFGPSTVILTGEYTGTIQSSKVWSY